MIFQQFKTHRATRRIIKLCFTTSFCILLLLIFSMFVLSGNDETHAKVVSTQEERHYSAFPLLQSASSSSELLEASSQAAALIRERYDFAHRIIDSEKWTKEAKHLPVLSSAACARAVELAPRTDFGEPILKLDGLQCVHGISTHSQKEYRKADNVVKHWESRRGKQEPWINVLHGGPSPRTMFRQGGLILALLGLDSAFLRLELSAQEKRIRREGKLNPAFVLAEIGVGNGMLLHSMCPVDPTLSVLCFGADITPPLIDDARSYFLHGVFDVGPVVSSLPNASATHVFSNGLMGVVEPGMGCAHIFEGLRLLSRGGIFVILMLGGEGGHWLTRVHPTFFNSSVLGGQPGDILRFCALHMKMDFTKLVSKIEFLFEANGDFLYGPSISHYIFVARLWRSDFPISGVSGGNNEKVQLTHVSEQTRRFLAGEISLSEAFHTRHKRLAQMWTKSRRASRRERDQSINWVDEK
jgi:hypothetical protein